MKKTNNNDQSETASYLLGVGNRIRVRRKQLKLTLKELSDKTQVPLSTLSKVETGQMSLNIQKMISVCNVLKFDVMQLVSPEEPEDKALTVITGRRSITLDNQAKRIQTEKTTYEHHASDFSNRKLSPTVIELEAEIRPELIRHKGEEFIYVLEGEVEVLTEFYEPTVLKIGESIYIDSTMAHNVRAIGGCKARILNIMTTQGN